MKKIGIISCVSMKHEGPLPAKDLYKSPYFKKMRGYAEANYSEYRIMSALHGLVHPDQVIEKYNKSLTDKGMKADDRRKWAEEVADAFAQEHRPGEAVIFVHGGKAYCEYLVPALRARGFEVHEPFANLMMGRLLEAYKAAGF